MKNVVRSLIRSAVLVAMVGGLISLPPSPAAAAVDVYTTPGVHAVNGRKWRTTCEAYSPTIERCRTEIEATQIVYTGGRFVSKFGWTFNNLTYKASPRGQWIGNILATPGEHTVGGRRWKTECDSAWTGLGACRSMVWGTTYQLVAGRYVTVPTWVFNNIVNFTAEPATPQFCTPSAMSPQGVASAGPASEPSSSPRTVSGEPTPTPGPASAEPSATATPESAGSVSGTDPIPSDPTPDEAERTDSLGSEPLTSQPPTSPAAAPSHAAATEPPDPEAASPLAATAVPEITAIRHTFVAGPLFDQLGPITVTGTVAGAPAGTAVRVELQGADGTTKSSDEVVTVDDGLFLGEVAGGFAGRATVLVTSLDVATSRTIDIGRASTTQSIPTALDPVAATPITGRTTPAIGGAIASAHVRTEAGWRAVAYARPAADGSYSIAFSYGSGWLASREVRICVTLPWGATIPSASSTTVTRTRQANPVVTQTTAAEVATTYRSGCPVAPSQLRTIRINRQSMDGHVYRGEIVVRSDRAADLVDVFRRAFEGGFPVYQMTNPNAFGASDPRMMAANNTSAFNCRRVVGNPYAVSPHSYGYAVDVNPVENPYRDPTGKWWPSTAHVSRTPVVPGQLTSTSIPVTAFKSRGWSWFSGWDWHHFEKR